MFKFKLTKGKTIFRVGPLEIDGQDLLIAGALTLLSLLVTIFVGGYSIIFLIISGIIFRNVLIAKGQIKK